MNWLHRIRSRASSSSDGGALRINLSFVLHERSDSTVITSAIQRYSDDVAGARNSPVAPSSTLGVASDDVDIWLSTRIGAASLVAAALTRAVGRPADVRFIDDTPDDDRLWSFFRAPAHLALPDHTVTMVGVAALVVRPGGRSTMLIADGPFAWPQRREAALGALEAIIRSYPDQWSPGRALWADPAELMLPDEIE